MGVIVTDRKYGNKYKPEIVNWLIGNVGDWQELKIEAEFTVEKIITLTSGVELIIGNIIKNMDGKEWSELGFDIGDTIHMTVKYFIYDAINDTNQTITLSWSRNILNIQGDEMTVDGSDITVLAGVPELTETGSINRLPYQNSVGQKTINSTQTIVLYTDKRPQGIELQYGHLDNDNAESTNLASFIDGTKTKFIAINTDTTASGTMQPTGMQSGMSVEDATWTYKSKTGHTYKYEFLIRYMISSFFEDTDNLANREAPTQVFDANSLTDNFKVIGYPTYNNPNTKIQSDLKATKRLGNTGWFDENFNGLKNDFEIKSVQYFDEATNEPLNALSYGAGTKVVARIGGIQNLSSSSKFSLGFIWTPEEEEYYKSVESSFHKNLLVNTAGAYSTQQIFSPATTVDTTIYNGFSTDNRRMDVKNVKFEIDGADIVYEAVFVPTIEFKNFMHDLPDFERNYVIWISVADHTLETNFSNRVSLLLDYQQMEVFIPPVGEWEPMSISFFEHPDEDTSEAKIACSHDFFVEDDILSKVDFSIDINNDIPNGMEFAIELENINTGEKHKLQSYNVNLDSFPIDGQGVPQWNYDESRGFKYVAGNNKNWIKVRRNPNEDTSSRYAYEAFYGFKVRWEDWINRTGLPADFFDSNLENNGFNNDWYEKMNHAGWELRFTVYTNAMLDGSPVKYVNSQSFVVKDYNSNAQIDKEWNFYRHSDNTLLNAGIDTETGQPLGILLQNEQVRVEVIWTRLSGTWSSLDEVYGTICIEVDKGAGQMEFRQLSSIWGSESDNPLIPLEGETRLKLTLVAPNVIKAECLVEPSLLIEATRYKHSARIGCKKGDVDKKDYFIFTNQEEIIDTFGEKFIIAQQ